MTEDQLIDLMRKEFTRQVEEDGVNYCSPLPEHADPDGSLFSLDGVFDLRKLAKVILTHQ